MTSIEQSVEQGTVGMPAGPGATVPTPQAEIVAGVPEVVGGTEEQGIAVLVADAARALADEPTLQQTLDRVVELAVSMVDGCESAGVSLVTRGRIESPAVSDPLVARGDELQYEFREGPCLDAVHDHALVESGDVEYMLSAPCAFSDV